MKKGFLFCIDGVDWAGKTGAINLLHDRMEEKYGDQGVMFHMPGGTQMGEELRRVIKSTKFKPTPKAERLLFAADNAQTMEDIVLPALEKRKILLSDRWSFITDYAYGLARGLDEAVMRDLQQFVPFVQADILFIFDCPFEEILRRKEALSKLPGQQKCRMEEQGAGFLEKVHGFYHAAGGNDDTFLARQIALRCARKIVTIDTHVCPPKEVINTVWNEITTTVESEG